MYIGPLSRVNRSPVPLLYGTYLEVEPLYTNITSLSSSRLEPLLWCNSLNEHYLRLEPHPLCGDNDTGE